MVHRMGIMLQNENLPNFFALPSLSLNREIFYHEPLLTMHELEIGNSSLATFVAKNDGL